MARASVKNSLVVAGRMTPDGFETIELVEGQSFEILGICGDVVITKDNFVLPKEGCYIEGKTPFEETMELLIALESVAPRESSPLRGTTVATYDIPPNNECAELLTNSERSREALIRMAEHIEEGSTKLEEFDHLKKVLELDALNVEIFNIYQREHFRIYGDNPGDLAVGDFIEEFDPPDYFR